jgi:hypothetical protein
MTRRQTTPQRVHGGHRTLGRTGLGLLASLGTLLLLAAPAMAQAPRDCQSQTAGDATCFDDPTGVLLSDGANKGFLLVGGDPAAQKGELGMCARNPSSPKAPTGQGGPGYYYIALANPPSAPAHIASCPGDAPPGDDYGQPKPQPQPDPDPPAEPDPDPPAEPPANPRPKDADRAKLKQCLKKAKKIDKKGKRKQAVERCHSRYGGE